MKEIIWFLRYVQAKSDAARQGCINEIAKIHGLSYQEAEQYVALVTSRAERW